MSEEKDVQGQAEKEEKGGKEKTSKSNIVLIVIGVIIILALIVVIILLLTRKEQVAPQAERPQPTRAVVQGNILTEDNIQDMFAETEPQVVVGQYEVKMAREWHFPRGAGISPDAFVENIEANSHDVYFDLFLGEDENHLIYSSPVIPRGASLDSIELSDVPEPGEYNCLMIYHLVDEEQNPVDSLRVMVPIIVGE
ncbi:MAG: hypothetical protein IKI75_05725 [Lachnospiraceae bacterium]|nr:hypothetical protein [Lachnospiraceae bacterium]